MSNIYDYIYVSVLLFFILGMSLPYFLCLCFYFSTYYIE